MAEGATIIYQNLPPMRAYEVVYYFLNLIVELVYLYKPVLNHHSKFFEAI
jgi:hypothetical protein